MAFVTCAILASASSAVFARATGRRKLSGKLVRKPRSTSPSRARSKSSASSVDSPIPNVRSNTARTTCRSARSTGAPTGAARDPPTVAPTVASEKTSSRSIRGRTCSSIIRSSSRGTPGMAKKTALPSRIENPGAVPIGFGSTSASVGKNACLRFTSDISRPTRAKKASMTASDFSSSTVFRPKVSANTSVVRSSRVGPSPPETSTKSLRSAARRNASRISAGSSNTET